MDETYLLEKYLRRLSKGCDGALNLEDDVAYLSRKKGERWVVSSDVMVEGVHYLSDMEASDIGWRLLGCGFSDLAGSGAVARGFMLNLTLVGMTATPNWLEGFCAGMEDFSDRFSVGLWGGDTTVASGNRANVLGVTVYGVVDGKMGNSVPSGLACRRGAQVGDGIYVTGSIGDSHLGLRMLENASDRRLLHAPGQKRLVECYYRPEPRLQAGRVLAKHATAMMDISDGLLLDAKRLLAASEVGGRIDLRGIPLSAEGQMCCRRQIATRSELASGGDDYELLFTLGEDTKPTSLDNLAEASGVAITKIGEVTEGEGLWVQENAERGAYLLEGGGYLHHLR